MEGKEEEEGKEEVAGKEDEDEDDKSRKTDGR